MLHYGTNNNIHETVSNFKRHTWQIKKKKIALPDTKKKKFLVLNFALQNDKNKLIWFA